jgi:hypothetical protein
MKEFEELKRIWDAQNNQALYAVNEEALYKRVTTKKNQALRTADVSEWLLIIVNLISGVFILATDFQMASTTFVLHVMAIWMLITALYLVVSRIQRIRNSNRFDRSLRGDLTYAIWVATYQVRLSQLMRWNIFPIAVLILLGIWDSGKSIGVSLITLILFAFAYYLSGWEHGFYQTRKDELETLKSKLEQES